MFVSIGIPELIVILAIFAFWIWTLVRILRDERNTTMRVVWFIVVFFTHLLGAILYWIVRASSRRR